MTIVKGKTGIAFNFFGTRWTKAGALMVGFRDKSWKVVLAGAFYNHDGAGHTTHTGEWAFAWIIGFHWPTTYWSKD